MFTLTTNLAIWMAAVVDESVHQAHAYSSSHGHSNTSHTRLTPDREFLCTLAPRPPSLGLGALRICSQSAEPSQGHADKGEIQGLLPLLGVVGVGDKEEEYGGHLILECEALAPLPGPMPPRRKGKGTWDHRGKPGKEVEVRSNHPVTMTQRQLPELYVCYTVLSV